MTEPESIALGTVITGRYRLERLLGMGGFGAVFAAADASSGQRVAVKILSRAALAEAGGEARFQREAELARRLSHPNTVRVLDSGTDPSGLLFIVFELYEGRSVDTALQQEGPLSPKRACTIAIEVLSALEEAHAVGIVHRDIKPGNIFLIHDQKVGAFGTLNAAALDRVKVLDFGIAKSTNANTHAGLTREGAAMGTPIYMAPEQMLGQALGPFTDLYALGLVLAEMVLGESVYGPNPSAMTVVADRIAGKPVPFPSVLVESALGPLLKRATADVVYRFRSATEMKQALQTVLPSLSLFAIETGRARASFVQAPTAASLDRGSSDHGPSIAFAPISSPTSAAPTERSRGASPLASSAVSWSSPTGAAVFTSSAKQRLASTAPDASPSRTSHLAKTTNDYEAEHTHRSGVSQKRLLDQTVPSDEPLSSLAARYAKPAAPAKSGHTFLIVSILFLVLVVVGLLGAYFYFGARLK